MALFAAAAARRAATSSLPLLRASVSRAGIPLLRPLAAAASRPMPFSSATGMKPRSADDLPSVIKSETKPAKNCVRDDEGESHPKEQGNRLICVVEKAEISMALHCTVYPLDRKIAINALVKREQPPSSGWEQPELEEDYDFAACDAHAEFSELDENLQRALYKFLEPIGLGTPVITKVSHGHKMSELQRLFWKKKLWDFVNKEDHRLFPELPFPNHPCLKQAEEIPKRFLSKTMYQGEKNKVLLSIFFDKKLLVSMPSLKPEHDKGKDIETLRRVWDRFQKIAGSASSKRKTR